MNTLNLDQIRSEFPTLQREVYGKNLVYFDNGATAHKPQEVIDAIDAFYENDNANIHRGVHHLSQIATQQYEDARKIISKYIGAAHDEEVLFTKGTTDSINLVASSFGQLMSEGDEVIISGMEHHSNIVPWQLLCEQRGCVLKVIPVTDRGELDMNGFDSLLTDKTKLVAVTHVSNTLGTVNPVDSIIEKAHAVGAKVLLDGAQSIQHMQVNMQEMNCDFYAFSGHKVFGPTGVGILYGKKDILNAMPPYQGGGDMIARVTFEKTTYNELPHKFEAGTPHIAGGIGLGAAFDYLNGMDMVKLVQYEKELLEYVENEIKSIEGVRIIGEADEKVSVLSFIVEGLHPFDVGTLLDKQGIAVRTGHHCTQPLMDQFEIPGTIRASFAFYNTKEEIDIFVVALKRSIQLLQ